MELKKPIPLGAWLEAFGFLPLSLRQQAEWEIAAKAKRSHCGHVGLNCQPVLSSRNCYATLMECPECGHTTLLV